MFIRWLKKTNDPRIGNRSASCDSGNMAWWRFTIWSNLICSLWHLWVWGINSSRKNRIPIVHWNYFPLFIIWIVNSTYVPHIRIWSVYLPHVGKYTHAAVKVGLQRTEPNRTEPLFHSPTDDPPGKCLTIEQVCTWISMHNRDRIGLMTDRQTATNRRLWGSRRRSRWSCMSLYHKRERRRKK